MTRSAWRATSKIPRAYESTDAPGEKFAMGAKAKGPIILLMLTACRL